MSSPLDRSQYLATSLSLSPAAFFRQPCVCMEVKATSEWESHRDKSTLIFPSVLIDLAAQYWPRSLLFPSEENTLWLRMNDVQTEEKPNAVRRAMFWLSSAPWSCAVSRYLEKSMCLRPYSHCLVLFLVSRLGFPWLCLKSPPYPHSLAPTLVHYSSLEGANENEWVNSDSECATFA